jgi:hypothetical protein
MTLKEFLSVTSDVPAPALRQAMTSALLVEPARTPDAYRRFYSRTVQELGLSSDDAAPGELDDLPHAWNLRYGSLGDARH